MPAKKNRRQPDAQRDLGAHAKAHSAAYEWAAKAIALRAAGKNAQAATAEKRAKIFLREAMEIEARYPPITRERHMTKPRE